MEIKTVRQTLAIVITTLGGGTTVYFLLNQQVGKATLSFIISFIWGAFAMSGRFLKELRDRIDQKLKDRADPLAEWIVGNLETLLLKLWWRLTSRFQANYYKSIVYRYRTFRTEGLKTKGRFALDLTKLFVPLRLADQSPELISPRMIQLKERQPTRLEIWDFLVALKEKAGPRQIAVIGAPGCGKTTLLEYLALTLALNTHRQLRKTAPTLIPILLYLRDIRNDIIGEHPLNLVQVIENQEFVRKLSPPPNWFDAKLNRKRCLVMLDGLDEVADQQQRNQVSKWINKQMLEYAETTFVLTSRPFGFANAPLDQVGIVLEVQPFSLKEIERFIRNWYLQSELMRQLRKDDPGVRELASKQAEDLIGRVKNNASLAAMAVNPLLLTMIATVHDNRGALPGRRVELYAEICDVLLGRRQEAKNISDSLTAKQKQAVLQTLALELMRIETRQFTLESGGFIISDILATVAGPEASPSRFLRHTSDLSGLIIERELGLYEFAHKSFQEYLAAAQVKETNDESVLLRNIDQPWWEETIRLYAAQSDATNLIKAALNLSTVDSLSLAYDCLEEGGRVSLAVRKLLEDKLEAGFASNTPEVARLAIEVRLSRRLHKLLRIDENVEIDTSYITCAEYQLFIDQKLKENEYHQPDHWPTYRFPEGTAADPITGIRSEDATHFCEWLNHQYPNREFRYRLPTFEELNANPVVGSEVGSWCSMGDKKVVAGISSNYWRDWEAQINKAFRVDVAFVRPDRPGQQDFQADYNNDSLTAPINISWLESYPLYTIRFDDRNLQRALNLMLVRDQKRDVELLSDIMRSLVFVLDIDLGDCSPALASGLKFFSPMDSASASTLVRASLLIISGLNPHIRSEKNNLSTLAEYFGHISKGPLNDYPTKREVVFSFYLFFLVLTKRELNQLPAWEGIRVVKETIV